MNSMREASVGEVAQVAAAMSEEDGTGSAASPCDARAGDNQETPLAQLPTTVELDVEVGSRKVSKIRRAKHAAVGHDGNE